MLMLVLSTGLVGATGLLLSARLAGGSVSHWLVGAYVLGFAEIVVVSLLLSPFSALSRWPLFGSLLAILCVAAVVARPAGLPPYRAAARALGTVVREPAVAVVAAVAACGAAYSFALAVFRPPNDQDALAYHLARAALWAQQHSIGFIPGARDVRLDTFAPDGEIAMAFTMVTSGSGRYAPLVQFVAGLASAAAVCGIARRLGFGVRESVLTGLLFLTLPVVAMQMSTGLNDLILASFVATAAFFLLERSAVSLVGAGVSTALMVGTKLTGLVALPGLAAIALVARRQRPLLLLAVGAVSIALGAYWYVFGHLEPGEAPGRITAARGHQGGAVTVLGRSVRLALAAVELPGAVGLDRLFYVLAAIVVAAAAVTVGAVTRRERYERAAAAAALTLAPLALVPLGHGILRTTRKLFFEIGRSDVGNLDADRSATKASPIFSWYGPLGVMLTLLAIALTIREVRRHALPAAAVLLALAPLIWIVLLAIAVPYWEWNGRYTMGGFALGASAWAVALRIRPVAWAAAAIAVLTVTLSFVHQHDRPSGLRLIEPTHETSIWSQPDWSVQATDHPELRAVLRFVDERVPARARLAVEPSVFPNQGPALRGDMLAYAFFGTDLTRRVYLADSLERARAVAADWAVLRAKRVGTCAAGWRIAFRYQNWAVLQRHPARHCG